MYAYTIKANKKTYYFTGKGMSTDHKDAMKFYSYRVAVNASYEAKAVSMRELESANVQIIEVDDMVYTVKNEGVFLTEETDNADWSGFDMLETVPVAEVNKQP